MGAPCHSCRRSKHRLMAGETGGGGGAAGQVCHLCGGKPSHREGWSLHEEGGAFFWEVGHAPHNQDAQPVGPVCLRRGNNTRKGSGPAPRHAARWDRPRPQCTSDQQQPRGGPGQPTPRAARPTPSQSSTRTFSSSSAKSLPACRSVYSRHTRSICPVTMLRFTAGGVAA